MYLAKLYIKKCQKQTISWRIDNIAHSVAESLRERVVLFTTIDLHYARWRNRKTMDY